MKKPTTTQIDKIAQRYIRNMELEMQRFANEILKFIPSEGVQNDKI